MKYLSAILAGLGLLLIPAALAAERWETRVWSERLLTPRFEIELNRHSPLHAEGTFLPPVITKNTTFTSANNPLILSSATTIAPGATVTLEAGTHLYAHEFATLNVEGHLVGEGIRENPIMLETNERHAGNQLWNGVVARAGSVVTLTHAEIRHASPALTCLPDSVATLANTRVIGSNLGLFSASPNCALSDSRLEGFRTGIISVGAKPQITNTIISAKEAAVKEF